MQVAKKDAIQAWWFSGGTTLPHGDGREIRVGLTHSVKGQIVACKHGLHGSENSLDALKYAPGAIVWRTRHWGTVKRDDDKICSTYREYVAGGVDASDILRVFARWCALQVYDKIAKYDTDGIIKRWLETGDLTIRDAARDAALSAARYAARDAASSAALSAATSAARDAARDAASSAARYAAEDAGESAQGEKLTEMLEALIAGK